MELLRSKTGKLLIEGHRAAEGIALENSWDAIVGGFEAGADLLEIDIHRAKDGSLVVYNGYTLPDGRWIRELERKDLEKTRIENQALPLLDQVLDWMANKSIALSLDIKNGFGFNRQIFMDVLDLIDRTNSVDKIVMLSWDHAGLRKIKDLNARIKTRLLFRGMPVNPIRLVADAKADGLNIDLDMVTKTLVNQLHNAGISVAVGMTRYLDIPLAIDYAIDVIQVTDPGKARSLLLETLGS